MSPGGEDCFFIHLELPLHVVSFISANSPLLIAELSAMSSSTVVPSHVPFPHNYTCWSSGWTAGMVMVAVNSTFILEPIPHDSTPVICSDGLWGPFEWTCH